MTHAEQFQAMEKFASPRWAKMLSMLSQASKQRLTHALPAGTTRQIGKQMLGRGHEGRVMPGFTAGHGPSAIKQFYDDPYNLAVNKAGRGITSKGVRNMLGDATIAERAALMRAHPDIFPKVLGQNPRGYVVERLTEMPLASPGAMLRKFTHPTTSSSPSKMRDIVGSWREGMALLANPKKTFWDWLSVRNSTGKLNNNLRARSTLSIHQPVDAGFAELATPAGNRYFVEDFGRTARGKWHNIMQTGSGRSVISDPVLTRQRMVGSRTAGSMPTAPMSAGRALVPSLHR